MNKVIEAFVYQWENTQNGMKYIGYHKGSKHDDYTFSSKDEDMIEANRRGYLEWTVLAEGLEHDMAIKEQELLEEVDAANNPMYYNKTNGGNRASKNRIRPLFDELIAQIEREEFPIKEYAITEVIEWTRHQGRMKQIDRDHVNEIRARIDDKINPTLSTELTPITVFEDYEDGDPNIVGGNHRIDATHASKQGHYIRVQLVPKKIWSQLNANEMAMVSNRLNPREKKPRLQINIEDGIKAARTLYDNGTPLHSDQLRNELSKQGFHSKTITKIIEDIEEQIRQDKLIPEGMMIKEYSKSQRKSLVKEFTDENTMVVCASTGGLQYNTILEKIGQNPHKKKVKVLLFHPSYKAKETWEKTYEPQHQTWKDLVFTPAGYDIEYVYLPMLVPDLFAGIMKRVGAKYV